MEVEIVEFYPKKSNKPGVITGTLHVYICDFDMDLRGCPVRVEKGRIRVTMPFFNQFDPDQGKVVSYPMLNLMDENKHRELYKEVIRKGVAYVKEYLKKK